MSPTRVFSQSAIRRCEAMSSLTSPTPRMPTRPLTMNGIEAMRRARSAVAAAIAGCTPDERSASLRRTVLASMLRTFVGSAPDTRRRDTSVAREKATRVARVIATAVPWPGSLIAMPLATRIAARPTGPANQVSSRRPHSDRIAWPTASEAAQRTATDAYAPSKGADRRGGPGPPTGAV